MQHKKRKIPKQRTPPAHKINYKEKRKQKNPSKHKARANQYKIASRTIESHKESTKTQPMEIETAHPLKIKKYERVSQPG